MVPDLQKVWTDGRRQNYIPPTSSGDNKTTCPEDFEFTRFDYKQQSYKPGNAVRKSDQSLLITS